MDAEERRELVGSTADCAFAIDASGAVVAWNRASEALFGLSADEVIGRPCADIVRAVDECGPVCSPNCTVQQAVRAGRPLENMDLLVQTREGRLWCNVSVLRAEEEHSGHPWAVHVLRRIDVRKRLELALRDFIAREAGLGARELARVRAVTRAPSRQAELTRREIQILRGLAAGERTSRIAARLHLSRATVNNHA